MKSGFKERFNQNLRRFEQFTVDVIYGKRQGRKAELMGLFLGGVSVIYRVVVWTRFYLYRHRIFRSQPLGCLVVVVGNLTVGGTGKTPVVERIARTLRDRGRTVGILSRGYKSKKEPAWKKGLRWMTHGEAPDPKVVSDGKNVLLDSRFAGDEPYMLAKNLPGVVVVVDKNRVKAGAYAIKKFGVDTLILDDGFQYLPLKGRLNLVLVDKTNPFGNGKLLPRGILRESVKNLRRASYVFITKSDGTSNEGLKEEILAYHPEVDIIECAHRPTRLCRVGAEHEWRGLEMLQDLPVACFSGIAVPEGFERFLEQLGSRLVHKERFLDHHRFSAWELEQVYAKAASSGAACMIITEKDAARLDLDYIPPMETWYLRLEIEIFEGTEDFEHAINRICFPKNERMRPMPRMVNS